MTGKMRLKTGRGFNSEFAGKVMTAEIVKSIREWAPEVTEQFDKFVADWSDTSRPEFIASPIKLQNNRGVSFGVRAKGSKTQKDRWKMMDSEGRKGGTKIFGGYAKEPMSPRNVQGKFGQYQTRKYLRFRHDYNAKTLEGAKYGQGDGSRSGRWVRKYVVTQGAIKPRNFSQEYMPKFKKNFLKASRRGYRRAFNKMMAGNKI